MDLEKNISVIGLFRGSINISGTVKTFVDNLKDFQMGIFFREKLTQK